MHQSQLDGLYFELEFLESEKAGFEKRIGEVRQKIAMLEREACEQDFKTVPDLAYLKKIAHSTTEKVTFSQFDKHGNRTEEKIDSYWIHGDL